MNCEKCGRSNPIGFRFCSGCGAPSAPPVTYSPPPVTQTNVIRQPSGGPTSIDFSWNRVMRFQGVITVGSVLVIVGLFLPWVSSYGFSFSGLSIHGFLWLSFLLMVAVLVLSVLEVLIPGFSESWPLRPVVAGIVLFSAVLILLGVVNMPGGFSWSFGPIWSLIVVISTALASLAPFVPSFAFLRLPISTSTMNANGFGGASSQAPPSAHGQIGSFCSSCGNAIDPSAQFCSSCGSPTK